MDIDNDNATEDVTVTGSKGGFIKPTVQEIKEYCEGKGYAVDAERFWNFYESKGWMVGRNSMTQWRSAAANWAKNAAQADGGRKSFEQHSYTVEDRRKMKLSAVEELEGLDSG